MLNATVPTIERLLVNQSASQSKEFQLCKRKWWMSKVARIKEREASHFIIGHALHGVAERYISKQARSFDALFPPGWDKRLAEEDKHWIRKSAQDAIAKGIWQAKPGVQVEYALAYLVGREHLDNRGMPLVAEATTYEDDKGVRKIANLKRLVDGRPLPVGWNRLPPYVGFVDVLDLHDNPPLIGDHKSAKSRKYTLSPEKLAQDTQVLSYAALPLALRPDVDRVSLRHFVFLKDDPDGESTYVTKAETTIDSVRNRWSDLIAVGEEMAALRAAVPAVDIPGHPEERARNYHMVPCAIEAGRIREACDAYKGCPYKDSCFNRATIQQVTYRLDSPDPMEALEKAGHIGAEAIAASKAQAKGRHGLNIANSAFSTASQPKETPMAFGKPNILTPGNDVYALDPENKAIQYRARVQANPDPTNGDQVLVQFYPEANVTPNWQTLPQEYSCSLPPGVFAGIPVMGATMMGYQQALVKAGMPAPAWETDSKQAQQFENAKAVASFGKVAVNPSFSPGNSGLGATALVPAATNALAQQMERAQQAEKAAVVTEATFSPQLYDTVQVIPSNHTFWGPLSGKTGTITDAYEGGTDYLVTVNVDGVEYPDVAAGRFTLVSRQSTQEVPAPAPTPAAAAAPVAPVVAPGPLNIAAAMALKGQLVAVRMKDRKASPFNGILEDADAYGITMMAGQVKRAWDEIEACESFQFNHVPGAPAPKEPKVKAPAVAGPDGVIPPEKPKKTRQKKNALPEAPATDAGEQPTASQLGGEPPAPAPAAPSLSDAPPATKISPRTVAYNEAMVKLSEAEECFESGMRLINQARQLFTASVLASMQEAAPLKAAAAGA